MMLPEENNTKTEKSSMFRIKPKRYYSRVMSANSRRIREYKKKLQMFQPKLSTNSDRETKTKTAIASLVESLENDSNTDRLTKIGETFQKICRTCLCETTDNTIDSEVVQSVDNVESKVKVKQMMETLTGLEINPSDELPKHICNDCKEQIQTAYKFRINSQRIDRLFKGYLTQVYPEQKRKEEDEDASDDTSSQMSEDVTIDEQAKDDKYLDLFAFECKTCHLYFPEKRDLDQHKVKHDGSQTHVYKCGKCFKEYKYRNGLHYHLESYHLRAKEYKCEVCSRTFARPANYRLHKKTCSLNPKVSIVSMKAPPRVVIYPIDEPLTKDNVMVEIKGFTCAFCNEQFELEADFCGHVIKTHYEKKICPHCNRLFSQPLYLEAHLRYHNSEKPFVCPLCLKGFTSSRSLRNHIKLHAERGCFSCDTCGNVYVSHIDLIAHMKEYKNTCKSIADEIQSKDQSKSPDLVKEEDIKMEPSGSAFQVNDSVVETIFSIKHIDEDMEQLNGKQENLIAVYPSIKAEPNPSALVLEDSDEKAIFTIKHIDTDQKPLLDDYKHSSLPSTSARYNSTQVVSRVEPSNAIEQHKTSDLEIKIKQEKPDECQTVHEIANEPVSDDDISEKSSDPDKTPIKVDLLTCAIPGCNFKYNRYREISNHIMLAHKRGPKDAWCPLCPKKFTFRQDLRSHLKTHELVEFNCQFCPKTYDSRRELIRHHRTHTGERPFKCKICSKAFKQAAAQRAHEITHSGKQFPCQICDKKFFSYNGLYLHSKSHENIEELRCCYCKRQFPSKHRLQRHMGSLCASRTAAMANVLKRNT